MQANNSIFHLIISAFLLLIAFVKPASGIAISLRDRLDSRTVAFYPLNPLFGIRDITANEIHATVTGSNTTLLTTAVGPYGGADTAYQIASVSNSRYLVFNSSRFLFSPLSSQSFTILVIVQTVSYNKDGPLISYYDQAVSNPRATVYARGWNQIELLRSATDGGGGKYTISDQLFSDTISTGKRWVTTGMVWDSSSQKLNVWNGTYAGAVSYQPLTTSTFSLGYMISSGSVTPGTYIYNGVFACLGVYSDKLSADDIAAHQSLCQQISMISCSANCVAGTCIGDATTPSGTRCQCQDDSYAPPDCTKLKIFCPNGCQGGTCVGANVCSCSPGSVNVGNCYQNCRNSPCV